MSRAMTWILWLVVIAVPVMFGLEVGWRAGLRITGAEMLGIAFGLWYGSLKAERFLARQHYRCNRCGNVMVTPLFCDDCVAVLNRQLVDYVEGQSSEPSNASRR